MIRLQVAGPATAHDPSSPASREVIAAALDSELPPDLEATKRQPLAGWKPCKLGDGWGAVLHGPGVTALAENARPAPISITDSRGTGPTEVLDSRGSHVVAPGRLPEFTRSSAQGRPEE